MRKIIVLISILAISVFLPVTLLQAATISISPSATIEVTENLSVSLTEVGTIVDNSHGGNATELDAAEDVFVKGDYAYVVSFFDKALSVFDISDPSNPTEVGTIKDGIGATQLDGVVSVDVQGNYAYTASLNDDALSVIDVSNPANPTEVGTIKDGIGATQLNGAVNVKVLGDYAYVTSRDDDALSIIDISSSTNPTEVGTIKDGVGATRLNAAWGIDVVGDYAYVTGYLDRALSIIDVSSSTNPTEVGTIVDSSLGGVATQLHSAQSVQVAGDYAYVASWGDKSLSIINVSNPLSPSEVGTIVDSSSGGTATQLNGANSVHVVGNLAFVMALNDNALSVIDVSDPANPIEKSVIVDGVGASELGSPDFLYVHGGYVYTTSTGDDALSVFSISGHYGFYSVELDEKPTDNVTVSVTSSDTSKGITVTPSTLIFTSNDWFKAQGILVTAVDDTSHEGVSSNIHAATISHTVSSNDGDYNGHSLSSVSVEITDNDPLQTGGAVGIAGKGTSKSEDEDKITEEENQGEEREDVEDDPLTEEERVSLQNQINEIKKLLETLIDLVRVKFGIIIDLEI